MLPANWLVYQTPGLSNRYCMGVTAYFWHSAIYVQLSTFSKKKTFSFKMHLTENMETYKIKWICTLLWNQRCMNYSALGQGRESRKGWFLPGISDIFLKTADHNKNNLDLSSRPDICTFSLCKTCFLRVTRHSPQGRELVWGWARWGNLPRQLQQMGTQERGPTETLHLQLPSLARSSGFLRPDQMACKGSRHSSSRALRKRWAR